MFRVNAIYVSGEKGARMREVRSACAIAGRGILDDRYEARLGSYSESKVGLRDATLISKEGLDDANRHPAVKEPFLPWHTRRNILVSGGPPNLCDLAGKRIGIGDAVFQFTEECTPCMRPSDLSCRPGFKEAFTDNGRGGIRTAVIKGGEFKVGDEIHIIDG